MTKIVLTLSLLAALVAAPGFVGSAEARHRHDRNCGHRYYDGGYGHRGAGYGYRGGGYGYRGGYGGSAWDIVQSDPCRAAEFARYARKHKNPNKRARKIEKLAREGCDDRYAYGYAGQPYGGGGYGYEPYGGYGYESYNRPYGAVNPYYNRYGYGAAPGTAEAVVLPLLDLFLNR
jgi:hypothetical protein